MRFRGRHLIPVQMPIERDDAIDVDCLVRLSKVNPQSLLVNGWIMNLLHG